MNIDDFKKIILSKSFRPFEIVTAGGERHQITKERQFLYNERKPDLLVFYDDTAKYRIVDVTHQRGGPMSRNQRWRGALGMRIYDSLAP